MATFSDRPNRIGKYEILSTIGRGGMGVVYKARDPKIDRVVAIKTILIGDDAGAGEDNLLDRLAMEARSAGRLQHPNIVTVYDFGEEDGLSYIVMEFVEGINLASLIDEKRALPLGTKLSILLQIADGLSYAHEHGVVHRDMKPSNVCVTARGNAKILDFGLARFDSTRLTKTGFMAGTIAYMSPERLNGTTGPKDDIFALGAIATPSAQSKLFEISIAASRPAPVRERALAQLTAHIQRHGNLLTELQLDELRKAARQESDPQLQTAFAATLGALHPDLRQATELLKAVPSRRTK